METISRYLLTFLLNSVWQIPVVAAVAALACRLMRHAPAGHRHAVWVAALAAAILLPVASVRTHPMAPTPRFALPSPSDAAPPARGGAAGKFAAVPAAAISQPAAGRTISLAGSTALVLLGAYSLFVLLRLAGLALAILRTLRIRQAAHAAAVPQALADVWQRCQESFGLTGVRLLFSTQVSGPVTAGRAIILPESLLGEPSADVLTTAIGHEMAHIARHDFAGNLLFEILYLPVSFQPATWLIRRGVGRTREIACDELVTGRLIDAGAYARSIVTIAAGMTALPQPGFTLGVFDGDILEERIRHLVERPAANRKRARLLLAAGLSAVAICAIAVSSLAFNARAQSGADSLITLGEEAYNRGDFSAAAAQFDAAVRMEPSHLKAKLFLAKALTQAIGAPPWKPENPLVVRVHQLYLDALALDPRNKQAHQGLGDLAITTRQYAEAHDWAVKAIQDDPSDATAYNTAAFADWCSSYSDFLAARQAAGMKLEDPGIIPDAGLRLTLRIQHMAQLEDGVRMLQAALLIEPDYSDAMAYMNLLYRIEAAISDSPAQYDDLIAQANNWVDKAMAAKRRQTQNAKPGAGFRMLNAPPPPPPPPPPPKADQ